MQVNSTISEHIVTELQVEDQLSVPKSLSPVCRLQLDKTPAVAEEPVWDTLQGQQVGWIGKDPQLGDSTFVTGNDFSTESSSMVYSMWSKGTICTLEWKEALDTDNVAGVAGTLEKLIDLLYNALCSLSKEIPHETK